MIVAQWTLGAPSDGNGREKRARRVTRTAVVYCRRARVVVTGKLSNRRETTSLAARTARLTRARELYALSLSATIKRTDTIFVLLSRPDRFGHVRDAVQSSSLLSFLSSS